VVLVTGAGGSIGSELCRQVARAAPSRLVLFGHGENSIFGVHRDLVAAFPSLAVVPAIGDIRDAARVARVMADWTPAVVFHAAAHKQVPLMEENPEEAITNNVFGTKTVVDAAIAAGVERFTLISTDKAVAPVSLMGASKRMAELVVRDAARRTGRAFVVVRFGNVLGSRGSVVPTFQRQILDGGPVTVTHPDMERFFMTIPEAVHLVVRAGGWGRGGELFSLNMGQPVKIVDLAEDLIRLSGFEAGEIPIVFTGLRRGEKLTEQLWEPGASVEQMDGDLWRIRERDDPSPAALAGALDALRAAVRSEHRLQIEAALASCIETFVPGLQGFTPSPGAAPQ
jgi:FlaA1/EpsC-like NDP-sugar epimerase